MNKIIRINKNNIMLYENDTLSCSILDELYIFSNNLVHNRDAILFNDLLDYILHFMSLNRKLFDNELSKLSSTLVKVGGKLGVYYIILDKILLYLEKEPQKVLISTLFHEEVNSLRDAFEVLLYIVVVWLISLD